MKEYKGMPGPLKIEQPYEGDDGGTVYEIINQNNLVFAKAETIEDANLIAASPELLSAVNLILELQLRGFITIGDKHTGTLRSAVAKALGESQ